MSGSRGIPKQTLAWLGERFGPVARVEPVAPDASTRTFYRLHRPDGQTAVAMIDDAGGARAIARMVAAGQRLAGAGVRVPEILDRDDGHAALLMEDLGGTLLVHAGETVPREDLANLYRQAGEMAGRTAALPLPAAGDPLAGPALGPQRLRSELAFFVVHDIVRRRGVDDRELLRDLGEALDGLVRRCLEHPLRMAHRDFHSRNLLVMDDGTLAAVDFQDALPAPPHYDLVSIVFDPYADPPPACLDATREAYCETLGLGPADLDPLEVARVGLQRLLKAIGTYARQALDLRREHFLTAIPVAETRAAALLATLPAAERAALARPLAAAGFPCQPNS